MLVTILFDKATDEWNRFSPGKPASQPQLLRFAAAYRFECLKHHRGRARAVTGANGRVSIVEQASCPGLQFAECALRIRAGRRRQLFHS